MQLEGHARRKKWFKKRRERWQLYLMILPAVVWLIIFCYVPMYGVTLAFKNFNFAKGIIGSPWVGFVNFRRLFSSYWFPTIIRKTLTISLLSLVMGFPMPIILSLMINEIGNLRIKKVFQTVSYAPHFISTIVVCGMVMLFLNPTNGIITKAIKTLGG